MPALVISIVSLIQMASSAAPAASKLYKEAKALFTMLFKGGLITVEQQQSLMSWADAHQAAVLAGEVPPEFTIDPDPE